MPETPPPETPPTESPSPSEPVSGRELATLRTLLHRVAEVIHRGLHELDPHPPEPLPPASGVEPAPPLATPADSGGATPTSGTAAPVTGTVATDPSPEPVTPAPSPPATPSPSPPATPAPSPPATPSAPSSTTPSPSGSGSTEPATPLPTPPTTEPKMPIGTKNFAFAHARIVSDGETVRVTKSTGFTPAITHPSDSDPAHCAPADDLPKVAKVKPEDAGKLPPNTLLYRLLLPTNHQIDKKEAVVVASGADRATLSHYRASAWAVDDRTVEVAVEIRQPDVNAKAAEKFAIDVIVFRVD